MASFAAVTLSIAAVVAPFVVLPSLLLICSVALAYAHPKFFVLVTALVLLFVRTLEYRSGMSQVGYLDEMCVFICAIVFPIMRLLAHGKLRLFPGFYCFAVYILCGLLSAVIRDVPTAVLVSGLLLAGKGVLCGWAVSQIDWAPSDISRMVKSGSVIMTFVFGCAVVNLAAPGFWTGTVMSSPGFGYRYGIPPIIGPFVHPGYFGTTVALFGLAALAYRVYHGSSAFNTAMLVASLVTTLLTVRRKVIAALLIGAGYLYIRVNGVKGVIVASVLVPIALVLIWPILMSVLDATATEYLSNPDEVARIRLYSDGAGVAFNYFPFGAGFGRFGSATARAYYSPEYADLGYRYVWGLGDTQESGKFLTDTFWPAVFGEAGFIGGLAFVFALWRIYSSFSRGAKSSSDARLSWLYTVAVLWTVELVIESMAGAVFTAAPTYGLFFGLIGIAGAYLQSEQSEQTGDGAVLGCRRWWIQGASS
ncbi:MULTISPECIES: hypothetical protein [unclassified Rhodococcus (in: high G+C Gram-positive bacteria)]|uniref:hypothetical protein n=1 Tax=unclassified Rhodococcus (in: high G+C Gram-positive bacteria) TaxID=192944 RepID=UPI0012E3F18E|nr:MULTISPECIES: hypothetical protein [unclassified Rhodococcus (in: high G+C Gram-positive bacteria)]